MSGKSNKKKFTFNKQEEESISVIDAINEHKKALTDDEFEALAICLGAVPPDGKRTREWAERKLKSVNRNKFTGLVSLHLMQCSKLDDVAIKVGEWAAPKERQIIEQETTHKVDSDQFEQTMRAYQKIKAMENGGD